MVKEIELTRGKVALIDDEDYEELNQYKWFASNHGGTWYARRWHDGQNVYMHRIIMDPNPDQEIDHKNRNGLDNRRENLRVCTRSENSANAQKLSGCSSQYKGVSWCKLRKKWVAYITVNGTRKFLGRYHDEKKAALAYNKAARKSWGKFAKLNELAEGRMR